MSDQLGVIITAALKAYQLGTSRSDICNDVLLAAQRAGLDSAEVVRAVEAILNVLDRRRPRRRRRRASPKPKGGIGKHVNRLCQE